MSFKSGNFIAKNIRYLEWLKAELVEDMGKLFKSLMQGSDKVTTEALSGILITVYLLARRIGLNFDDLDNAVQTKIKKQIDKENEADKWQEELSQLNEYIRKR